MKKPKIEETKGITLIALVITIIVLLILAEVSIAMLTGENGILTQAGNAKIETSGAAVQEACDLWKASKKADEYTSNATAQTLEQVLEDLKNQGNLTVEEVEIIKSTKKITIGKRTINFNDIIQAGQTAKGGKAEYTDGTSTAIIPKGFTVSDIEGETTIKTGLVVTAPDGSQFIWVPVTTAVSDTESKRNNK